MRMPAILAYPKDRLFWPPSVLRSFRGESPSWPAFPSLRAVVLDVMQRFEQDVTAWLDGARRDVEIWNADMKKLRLRISESETYRLFSGDLFGLDSRVAGVINSAEQTGNLPGPAAVLSEEVPAIRRILLEFMNYNGLLDARLVNKNGQTILSAFSTPSPLSPEQNSAAQQTMKTGETSFLPVRGSVNGLALDVFEPVYDLDSPEKCVAVFMSSVPVLSKVTQFTARPKQNDMSTAAMVQRRGDVWEKMQVPSPVAVPAALGKELADHKGVLPFGLRESVSEGGGMVYSMSVFFPAWSGVSCMKRRNPWWKAWCSAPNCPCMRSACWPGSASCC